MDTIRVISIFVVVVLALGIAASAQGVNSERGFMENPPVFIDNEHDVPLAGMGAFIPPAGKTIPDFDALSVQSESFRQDGVNVQPQLGLKFDVERLGALHGFNDCWAMGVSIAYQRTHARGLISGQEATGIINAFGDTVLVAKKRFWNRREEESIVATAGLELPTGKDDATFGASNSVTNAYYRDFPRRMPISWQPGSGSVDGYLALAYGRRRHRLSYVGLLAAKLHTPGDEDVKIGDIFIAAASATYGITEKLAASLGLTLRTQADDSYPNSAPPGVDQPILAGTTTHGMTLYIDPSVRFNAFNKITVGVGLRFPAIKPDNGMSPDTRVFLIVYPNL
ncbi:MAG: transporter [Armatimonadetes bacterium]|nr:transporter [Armatimonadota bacterium]